MTITYSLDLCHRLETMRWLQWVYLKTYIFQIWSRARKYTKGGWVIWSSGLTAQAEIDSTKVAWATGWEYTLWCYTKHKNDLTYCTWTSFWIFKMAAEGYSFSPQL